QDDRWAVTAFQHGGGDPGQLEPPLGDWQLGQESLTGVLTVGTLGRGVVATQRCHGLLLDRSHMQGTSRRTGLASRELPKPPRTRRVGSFPHRGHTSRCSYAKAVAAARDDTPSLVKRLL